MIEFMKPPPSYVFPGIGRFENRFLWEVLPDGSWKGKPCFIIGGGPSLRNFNWELLKGKRTISVNRAYEKIDATIIFSMDTRFLQWIIKGKYGTEAKEKFINSRSYKVWLCTYNCKLPEYCFIIKVHKNYQTGFRSFTDNLKDGIGHGNNSGYAALNMAACLGANPIYLLGFDMKHKKIDPDKLDEDLKKNIKTLTHWHDGHPEPQKPKKVSGFIEYFKLAAVKCRERKINIFNLSPDSDLHYFEKKKIEEVLN